ncbi:MAG: hypothetical protein CBC13_09755 [Planctomycetia bacterium TMED53]|nr:MAG: hypothetical protein CBC13_09755 [Planctomycetia bacterium TMED53]
MKSSTERLKSVLKIREAELESAVGLLLLKKSGLHEVMEQLKELKKESASISQEMKSTNGVDESLEPMVHGRYLARLRREVMRLSKEVTGLQETVDVARSKVKSAHGRHGAVKLLITQRQEKELLQEMQKEQRQVDGDSCQRFIANEIRGEVS